MSNSMATPTVPSEGRQRETESPSLVPNSKFLVPFASRSPTLRLSRMFPRFRLVYHSFSQTVLSMFPVFSSSCFSNFQSPSAGSLRCHILDSMSSGTFFPCSLIVFLVDWSRLFRFLSSGLLPFLTIPSLFRLGCACFSKSPVCQML